MATIDINIDTVIRDANFAVLGTDCDDVIWGSQFPEWIKGGMGSDAIWGGAGDDWLEGGKDGRIDLLAGGTGNDTYVLDEYEAVDESWHNAYYYGAGIDTIRASLTYSLDPCDTAHNGGLLRGEIENLVLTGRAHIDGYGNALDNMLTGNDGNNRLFGGAGNDRIEGGYGADVLDGGVGNDTLDGGECIDRLLGGAGNDILTGSYSDDILTGGAGADRFHFSTPFYTGCDTITDFVTRVDKLEFNARDYGFTAGRGLTAAQFHLGCAPVGKGAQFWFNPADHTLHYDADGTGAKAGLTLAVLGTLKAIAATDFVFI